MERTPDADGPPTTDERPTTDEHGPRLPARARGGTSTRYRLGALLGRGGMGEVNAAHDDQIGREVAVKRVRAEVASDLTVQRFLREARVQGRLDHPAIVPVYELGRDDDGLPFFVMKMLTGTTLARILSTEPDPRFSRERLLRAFADVCLAIEFSHVRGVIHRDLKPENIMLGDFGEVYVLDWGIAKVLGEDDEFSDVRSDGHGTHAGAMMGTIGYMSPEQAGGAPDVDARADIYALGCLLFEILVREPLHLRERAFGPDVFAIDARPSVRAPAAAIAPELDALCLAATAPSRGERIATARELGERVQRYLDGDRDLAVRRELARDRLTRARAAFESDDSEDQRRIAMREAGHALALDPTLAGAAELVSRLMLEPPRTMPREVEQAIHAEDLDANRRHARTSLWLYVGFLGFLPFIVGYRDGWATVAAYVAVVMFNIALVWRRALTSSPPSSWALAIRHTVVIAMLAHIFSPFFVAPAIAVVFTFALLLTPIYWRVRSVAVLATMMCLGVIVPWGLEAVGLVSQTTQFTSTDLVMRLPVIGSSAAFWSTGVIIFTVTLVAVAAILAHTVRRGERDHRRALQLQAWQLRQLVP